MTVGTFVQVESLPLMSEADARATLREHRHVYGVPADWRSEDHGPEVLVFTGDPILAAYCADIIARRDIGDSYRTYAGGGVAVDGPIEVVLVGIPGTEFIDWRPVGEVFTQPACDDAERERRYALLMCRVRPARDRTPEFRAQLVDELHTVGVLVRGRS
jgi:hypothetical protein